MYIPYGLIDNILVLVQIMAWRRTVMAQFTDPYMRHPASMN